VYHGLDFINASTEMPESRDASEFRANVETRPQEAAGGRLTPPTWYRMT
jgi:hypothetical protein